MSSYEECAKVAEGTPAGMKLAAAGFFPALTHRSEKGSWMKGFLDGPVALIGDGFGGLGENLDINSGIWCAVVYDGDDDDRCANYQAVGLPVVIEWCNAALDDPEPFFVAANRRR
jgi:hypothetical protein